MELSTEYINPSMEAFAYRMSEEEAKGLYDLLSMYSPQGPLRKVVTYFGQSGGKPIDVGHCEYYDFDYMLRKISGLYSLDSGISQSLFAGGKGYDVPGMFISSVAEAVERIVGSLAFLEQGDRIHYGTMRDLVKDGYNCVGPDELYLFADEQYESGELYYERFTEDTFLGWVEGKRLISGESAWMPAQLAYIFYSLRSDEALIGYATSGGLASHVSREHAIFHGLTELIERDAVNVRWNCRIAPERIELDRPVRLRPLARLIDEAEALPGEVRFYNHTVAFPEVPVVTVKEFCPWLKRWAYYAGGGVNLDIDEAMLQATTEYGQSERSLRLVSASPNRGFSHGVRRIFDIREDTPISEIDLFYKVVAYYGYASNRAKLRWYVDENPTVPLSSLPTSDARDDKERLKILLKILEKNGLDPLVFDFTPPQMDQVKLMKVFSTELVPPYLHSKAQLGHPRYYNVPYEMGLTSKPLTYDQLTQDPLPYP